MQLYLAIILPWPFTCMNVLQANTKHSFLYYSEIMEETVNGPLKFTLFFFHELAHDCIAILYFPASLAVGYGHKS